MLHTIFGLEKNQLTPSLLVISYIDTEVTFHYSLVNLLDINITTALKLQHKIFHKQQMDCLWVFLAFIYNSYLKEVDKYDTGIHMQYNETYVLQCRFASVFCVMLFFFSLIW